MASKKSKESTKYIWATLRILIGLIMLWAFVDKMFGLGYATCRSVDKVTKAEQVVVMCDKAVIKGGSATTGFLKFATKGPLKEFYGNLAGNVVVDTLFMLGLLAIGLALISGVGVKIASVSAIIMFVMMWSALLPPENHPVLDDHIVYIVVMLGVLKTANEPVWGLGGWWQKQSIVKKYSILA